MFFDVPVPPTSSMGYCSFFTVFNLDETCIQCSVVLNSGQIVPNLGILTEERKKLVIEVGAPPKNATNGTK